MLVMLSLFLTSSYAQTPAALVSEFGANLSAWAETRDDSYMIELYELSTKKSPNVIVADQLSHMLAQKNKYGLNKSYRWGNYEVWLQKEIDKGLKITVSNVRELSASEVSVVSGNASAYKYATCRIKVTGAINLDENATFVIAGNKIAKIADYVEETNQKTGKRRVKIELDFEPDYDNSWGIMYSYGMKTPVQLTIDATIGPFYLGLDIGIPTNRPEYTTLKIDRFNNLMDFKAEKGKYRPNYFVTFGFGYYMKYFSASVGIGAMSLSGKTVSADYRFNYAGGSVSGSGSSTTSQDYKYKFMVKPSLKGYIPCSDRFSLSLGVGYDYVVGYTKLNGFNFGLGFRLGFD